MGGHNVTTRREYESLGNYLLSPPCPNKTHGESLNARVNPPQPRVEVVEEGT